jgi:site-specific DNA recombinase
MSKEAVYIRTNNKDREPQAQLEAIKEYSKLKFDGKIEFTPETIYIDENISGLLRDKPALKRLLKDAEDKKIHTVIVFDLSRITRDMVEAIETLTLLRKLGVRVISCADGFDSENSDGLAYRLLKAHHDNQ